MSYWDSSTLAKAVSQGTGFRRLPVARETDRPAAHVALEQFEVTLTLRRQEAEGAIRAIGGLLDRRLDRVGR